MKTNLWCTAVACARPGVVMSLVLAATASQAAVVQVGTRGALGVASIVNWSSFGPEFTSVANGTTAAGVNVTGSSSSFTVLSGSTFNADFLPTDNVLALFSMSTGNVASGSFRLEFAAPVFAAGAQVQANAFGSFSGTIQAFNSANVLLATGLVSGSNGGNGTGSAVFGGFRSDVADIKALVFTGFGDGAGINQLSVVPVPEPATWLLWLAGGLLVSRRLCQRR